MSYVGTLLKSFRQGDVAIEKLLEISLEHKRLEHRIVAPQPKSRKYQNVPLVHAFAAALSRCFSIDVTSDQRHDYFSGVGPEVHLLKRSLNRFDRVSAFEVEFNLIDRWNVQTKLG